MKIASWCRANAMPLIAVLAAAVTACFVPPDAAYAGYFDWKPCPACSACWQWCAPCAAWACSR